MIHDIHRYSLSHHTHLLSLVTKIYPHMEKHIYAKYVAVFGVNVRGNIRGASSSLHNLVLKAVRCARGMLATFSTNRA